MIMRMAKGVKDSALSLLVKKFVNERFSQYGEMLDCEVDTDNNRVWVSCLLKGDSAPTEASIERYEIVREEDGSYIRLKQFSSSREWLTAILDRYLLEKQFRLPAPISKLL